MSQVPDSLHSVQDLFDTDPLLYSSFCLPCSEFGPSFVSCPSGVGSLLPWRFNAPVLGHTYENIQRCLQDVQNIKRLSSCICLSRLLIIFWMLLTRFTLKVLALCYPKDYQKINTPAPFQFCPTAKPRDEPLKFSSFVQHKLTFFPRDGALDGCFYEPI